MNDLTYEYEKHEGHWDVYGHDPISGRYRLPGNYATPEAGYLATGLNVDRLFPIVRASHDGTRYLPIHLLNVAYERAGQSEAGEDWA